MAEHLTEEEQVEALKRWWNENWLSIVLPVALVLVGYFGWNGWNNHQLAEAQVASDKFEGLSAAAEVEPGAAMSAEQKLTVSELAQALVAEHDDTLYADMANLLLAKLHVEDNQLDEAAARLEMVVDNGANESISQLAKARLARVVSAQGDNEAALALVSSASSQAYKALFAEIRGDIYLAQGDEGAAHTAYADALRALPASEFNRTSFIQLKQDSVAKPEVASPEQSPVEEAAAGDAEGDA